MDFVFSSSDMAAFTGQLLSSVIGLLGVFVGAHIAKSGSRKQSYCDSLRAAYSLVFERYTAWIPTQDINHAAALVGAICSAMLIAGPKTRDSLNDFLDVMIKPNPDSASCKECLDNFWNCAEEEIRKSYGK